MSDFTEFTIDQLYPTPKIRVDNPLPTVYEVGDRVRILIGSATGKEGVVVVDRNGNYKDYEPYCSKESIGVAVLEKGKIDPVLRAVMTEIDNKFSKPLYRSVIRWFDTPDQLELIEESNE